MKKNMLLMSIKPEYLCKILNGSKTIELRKTRPRVSQGDLIVFYASSPSMAVCGVATVNTLIEDTPGGIWQNHRDVLGIDKQLYDIYFENSKKAFGIAIGKVWEYNCPLPLNVLRNSISNFIAPQSFRYLTKSDFNVIVALEKKACRSKHACRREQTQQSATLQHRGALKTRRNRDPVCSYSI